MILVKKSNIPGIDTIEYKDKLYFNKYEYKLNFKLPGVHTVYRQKSIDDFFVKVRHKMFSSWVLKNIGPSFDAVTEMVKLLHTIRALKTTLIRVDYNHVTLYANDTTHFNEIQKLLPNTPIKTSKCTTQPNPKEVMYFLNKPKFKFRVYLKESKISNSVKKDMTDFLLERQDINLSRSFRNWLTATNIRHFGADYSCSHFYIEYNDEAILTYLHFLLSEILGKTYRLEQGDIT